jgi:glycosyltransferase involved in cell wall biosynthesis
MSSVCVTIPCYNYGRFLAQAVSSVLDDQDGVDVRVLIIDDASTEDSADIAREIAARRPRVELVVHPVNRGHLATYNEGVLDWADGDYALVLSADDRLTPGSLRRAVDLLDARPEVGFAYGHPLHYRQDSPLRVARTTVRGWSVWPGHQWLQRRFRDANSCITSPEVVVRTSVQKRVGGYDLRLPHTADMEMWLRLAAYGDVGYVRGVDQAFYRVHGDSMTTSRTPLIDLRQRRLAYEVTLERCADALPNADRLSAIVHRRIAWQALWFAARAYDRRRTQETPVDELVEFAIDCWPGATRLPVYRTLQLRRRIGPTVMPYLQPFIVSAALRKAQSSWRWQSWKWRGV